MLLREKGPLPPAEIYELALQVARGLGKRDRAAASDLIDGLLNGSMRPFFSEQSRQGAQPENWIHMVEMINVGVAQADGETEPGFRLSP